MKVAFMALDHMSPEQVDALGRMNKKIYDEYRNLGFAGITVDPVRFLSFRKQTNNDRFIELVVSDAGVFFMDTARKVKYKFDPNYFFVYHDGLHAVEEEKIKNMEGPVVVLENLLEFWKKQGTGFCLVADHLNNCSFLSENQKTELVRTQKLYSGESFIINPMLQKKIREKPSSAVQVVSLDD
jgi:hypothetical protein